MSLNAVFLQPCMCFLGSFNPDQMYRPNHEFVAKINNAQKSWKAVQYEEYETMTLGDLVRRAGGPKSRSHRSDTHLV